MNNEISKAIMTRTRLRNRFLKNRSNRNRDLFRKQRNLCVSLLRKAKKDYFSKLNEKQITDNKRFWKTVKLFLSNKFQSSERIKLTDKNDSLVTDCGKVAEELNSFFSSIVKNLNIRNYEGCGPLSDNIDHATLKAIVKWRNHPSILTINPLILFRKNMFLKKYKCWIPQKLSKKPIFLLS